MNGNIQKYTLCLLFIWILGEGTMAQFNTPVLTGMEGQALLDELVVQYKPVNIFGYGQARDTLFSKVYMKDDSLTCIYSGHTIYLNPNEDPTTTAFQNGMNTEHTYPQGLGAGSGNAKSDMHHLYPTRVSVNAARAALPFGEVLDTQTEKWFYLTQELITIPSQNIDAYSEEGSDTFEPREDHKGNAARAMFYFYTMYKQEANAADPNYFESQKETLCGWHLLDPVDQDEWERNAIIASYQEGKENPFALDSTLAKRSYCADFISSISTPGQTKEFELFQNIPNPFHETTQIRYHLNQGFQVRLKLFDSTGVLREILIDEKQNKGLYSIELNSSVLENGNLYFYQLELFDGNNVHTTSRKLLKH